KTAPTGDHDPSTLQRNTDYNLTHRPTVTSPPRSNDCLNHLAKNSPEKRYIIPSCQP
ncbi:Hypothetical predicted protein, partial [Pelobates cultripes]